MRKTNVNDFKLNLITKNGTDGEYTFGFIELADMNDYQTFVSSKITIENQRIYVKASEKR